MEILSYTHLSLAYEEADDPEAQAYELKLLKGLNWKPPSSAWIGLIASIMALLILSLANSAMAAFVRTNGSSLNVRSSPDSTIVGTLPNGASISLSGRSSGSWSQLSNGNWVASRWIRGGSGGGDGGGSPSNTGYQSYRVSTRGGSLNVRSGPSTGYRVISTLASGTVVRGGAVSNGWRALEPGGWVSSRYLANTGGGDDGGVPSSYLRRGSSGQAVTNLQNRLKVLGFYKAPVTGYYGIVTETAIKDFQASRNIQVNGIAGPQTQAALYSNGGSTISRRPSSSNLYEAYVSTNGEALPAYSSPNGRIIGSLPNGDRLLMTGRTSGSWVQAQNGSWVNERFIRYSGLTF